MDRNFARSLQLVLAHEGGYVNHPSDPGGATNKGVTLKTYRRYVDPSGTVEDLKSISDAQLGVVYRRHYWNEVNAAMLPDGLDHALFDFAVNSGPARAAKMLQAVVGVAQDGRIAKITIDAVERKGCVATIEALCDARLSFLQRLRTWSSFGRGWKSRILRVRGEALAISRAWQSANSKPVALLQPVEIPGLDKPMTRSSTVWSAISNAAASPVLTTAGGLLYGLDWRVVAVLSIAGLLAGAGFAAWTILQRKRYARAQRDIVTSMKVFNAARAKPEFDLAAAIAQVHADADGLAEVK